jgi:formamidopyrimidine-DNA glycosylase
MVPNRYKQMRCAQTEHAARSGRVAGDVPEGDSVYVLARRLDRALKGRLLSRSDLRTPSVATLDLSGRTVLEHATHGKHLLTRLSDDLTLHTHLRMQGSWTVVGPGKRLPSRLMGDVRVVLETHQGPTAYGVLLPVVDVVWTTREHELVGHLGPDPLREDWDAEEAVRRIEQEPMRPVVAALLDQRLVAGLGNLWANELCFLRGIGPGTPVGEVDVPALVRLAAKALRTSALVPGAYQVTTGNTRRGEQHWVAGRAGRPCLRCGTPVLVVDEVPNDPDRRRTWWCPTCQPGPGPER